MIICYTALALIRFVEFSLKQGGLYLTTEQLHRILEQVRVVEIITNQGDKYELLENIPEEISKITHS